MLAHPTLEQLHALGLHGLAKGFKEPENKAETRGLDHAEWLGLLLEYEMTLRRQKQFETRARVARLRHQASVEDVNYQIPRGLDRALFLKLAACDWIAERRNLLVTGAIGLGKSWLACALGHKACRENMSVLYTRIPRLFADLAIAHGDARYARLLRSIARVKLLILDDWGPETLTPEQARDLLEIVEDRYDKGSLIITSQVPVDRWHEMIGIPTLADAALSTMPIGSIWRVKAFESRFRPHEINALLTNQKRRNIFNLDLRQQTASGRLQIVTPAGFKSVRRPASYWNAWPASSVSASRTVDR
jgi:DNA replication protein DnaC